MLSRVVILCMIAGGSLAAVPAIAAEDLAVTPEIERAVSRGLECLARSQQPAGNWQEQQASIPGVVGLAILSFLAHGNTPDDPQYGPVIRRGVDYILASQQANGLFSRDNSSPMYGHGFATLAIAEVYGMIDDPRIGPALKKATGLIVSSQNTQGGWRYSVGSADSDTTVAGAQMMALRAAANAGIEVPIETIRRGVGFYKSCFCPGGGFGYTGPGGPNRARSGIGLLVLSLSGQYRSPEVRATADWLLSSAPTHEGGWFFYMCYYCSQAAYQAGGKYWRAWNDSMTPAIINMQRPDGSWQEGSTGVVCSTAFALLSIEVNYNLLPIYQR